MAQALSGELSFASSVEWLDRSGHDVPAAIDLARVTRSDSAGLALLLELTRRARRSGGSLKLQNAPPQLRKLAAFFGLDELLQFA